MSGAASGRTGHRSSEYRHKRQPGYSANSNLFGAEENLQTIAQRRNRKLNQFSKLWSVARKANHPSFEDKRSGDTQQAAELPENTGL